MTAKGMTGILTSVPDVYTEAAQVRVPEDLETRSLHISAAGAEWQEAPRLQDFQARNAGESAKWQAKLKQAVIDNGNVFEVMVDAVRYCSLGQITSALYEVGGQYRRNM